MDNPAATPGTLDPTFADGGVFYVDDRDALTRVDTPADGRVLATGTSASPPKVIVRLLKLDQNGVRAPDFGNNGVATVYPELTLDIEINSVVELPSGRLLVLAVATDAISIAFPMIIRLTSGGDPDPSFGPDGNGVVKLPLLGGHPNQGILGCIASDGRHTFFSVGNCVFKLTDDGRLDSTFGQEGFIRLTHAAQPVRGAGVTLTANRIVAAGHLSDSSAAIFIGLQLNGEIDTSYATNGISLIPWHEDIRIRDVVMLADHSIAAVGVSDGGVFDLKGLVIRVDAEGRLHPDFNAGQPLELISGYARTTPMHITTSLTYQLYVNANLANEDFQPHVALASISPTGSMDDSFGANGWVVHDQSSSFGLTQDHSGKLLITSFFPGEIAYPFRVMRFNT